MRGGIPSEYAGAHLPSTNTATKPDLDRVWQGSVRGAGELVSGEAAFGELTPPFLFSRPWFTCAAICSATSGLRRRCFSTWIGSQSCLRRGRWPLPLCGGWWNSKTSLLRIPTAPTNLCSRCLRGAARREPGPRLPGGTACSRSFVSERLIPPPPPTEPEGEVRGASL